MTRILSEPQHRTTSRSILSGRPQAFTHSGPYPPNGLDSSEASTGGLPSSKRRKRSRVWRDYSVAPSSLHTRHPDYRTLEVVSLTATLRRLLKPLCRPPPRIVRTMTDTDVLFAFSAAGFVLSAAYFVAECMRWQTQHAADRKTAHRLRLLYAKLFSVESIRRSARGLVVRPLTKLTGKRPKGPR